MIFFQFVLWFLLAEAILIALFFLTRKISIPFWVNLIIFPIELFATIALAFLIMTASAPLNPFIPFLMGLYVALFGDSVARLLTALFSIFKKKGKKVLFHSVLSFCLASALLVFGIVNSQIVTPKYLSFSSSKLTHEYKIAFVADLHIGSAQPIEKPRRPSIG